MIQLHPHQIEAVKQMFSGCILYGKVGSGKSLTSLFYFKEQQKDKKLYIITTAKKRDTKEWTEDLDKLGLTGIVDSWQNIKKYINIKDSFFIFDEQRSGGTGVWGKSFLKICKQNDWVLLSGTPGDIWLDYMNVFIANGFYKNKTEFHDRHVVYDKFSKYPKINGYRGESLLEEHRVRVLVNMPYEMHTLRKRMYRNVDYDAQLYLNTFNNRWDYETNLPIENVSQLISKLRKIVNADTRRMAMAGHFIEECGTSIIFYNYNYELEKIKTICEGMGIKYAQWNGHKHEPLPEGDEWTYIVQYTAGAEGWNCITTNNVIFYSLNYSYKITEQCEGRIDRMNTTHTLLNYYYLTSKSPVDAAIRRALDKKGKFNENAWAKKQGVSYAGE